MRRAAAGGTLSETGSRGSGPLPGGLVVRTIDLTVETRGQGDAVDITRDVARAVASSGIVSGLVTVFVVGSTAAVTTLEFEPGVVADLDRALDKVAPRHGEYQHHLRWGDDNGSAHVRAGIVGPSLSVPFREARLLLGTWQQIAVVEFDTRPRARACVLQIIGD